jgi:hypothetical protein
LGFLRDINSWETEKKLPMKPWTHLIPPALPIPLSSAPLRRSFLRVSLALGFAHLVLSPATRAQLPSPTPDGGYPGENTAEGDSALFGLTTGQDNTATGFQALYSNTAGTDNTANGVNALFSNTTADDNTATGFEALYSNTTGSDNTANGVNALLSYYNEDGTSR